MWLISNKLQLDDNNTKLMLAAPKKHHNTEHGLVLFHASRKTVSSKQWLHGARSAVSLNDEWDNAEMPLQLFTHNSLCHALVFACPCPTAPFAGLLKPPDLYVLSAVCLRLMHAQYRPHTHTHIHTHTHMYTHTHSHSCTETHTHTHSCANTHTHEHMPPHTFLHANTHTLLHADTHTHTHAHMLVDAHTHTLTTIHKIRDPTHQHTHTHTHMHTSNTDTM